MVTKQVYVCVGVTGVNYINKSKQLHKRHAFHIFLYQEAANYMYICTCKTDKIPLLGFLGFFIKALMNESNTEGST